MAKTAPFNCPKCGEEKEWKCLNDPTDDRSGNVARSFIQAGFGLLGAGIFSLFYKGSRLKYRCGKCGFTSTYSPD